MLAKLTNPKRWTLSALLLLSLASCQQTQQPASTPVADAAPAEALKSLCLAWGNSQPTWADADTEQTKD